jgi:hypothetical protein
MQPLVQVPAQGEEMAVVVGPIDSAGVVADFALRVAGEEVLGVHSRLRLVAAQALGHGHQGIQG